jgi:glycosyltransferase involved in cell wall biosynthesis
VNQNKNGFSFIIPAFNAEESISGTISALYSAISLSKIVNYEVIIVDDGSTDFTDSIVREMNLVGISIINQSNQGRLRARLNGIKSSKYKNLVLLDSRLWVDPMALVRLESTLREREPKMVIARILFAKSNLLGIFWDGIARIVWRNYYKNERDVILTIKNFDLYPKGTGFLYVDKKTILDSYELLTEEQLKNRNTNDDTLIIKSIVKKSEVLLSKKMIGLYFPRTNLFSFLRHAKHRGYVASDGYFAQGTIGRNRLAPASILLVALAIISLLFKPLFFLLAFLAIGIEIYIYRITSFRHFLSLNLYSFPFLISYLLGFINYKKGKIATPK